MIKPHKFFERFLDNDLNNFYDYLISQQKELLSGNIGDIPKDILNKHSEVSAPTTKLGSYYNIFKFDNTYISNLLDALRSATIEASEYYGFNYNDQDYMINGWYNVDYRVEIAGVVSPIKKPSHYHDHMGGEGAPVFHGYYCVNAEPSITYYKIGGINGTEFENINKNNRAIISETGHPHGRDDWYDDKPRITIAYDICPASHGYGPNWIKL